MNGPNANEDFQLGLQDLQFLVGMLYRELQRQRIDFQQELAVLRNRIQMDFQQELARLRNQIYILDHNNMVLNQRIEYFSRLAHARAWNATANQESSTLMPLPLPNNGYPNPNVFPLTRGDFCALDGPGLTELMNLYEVARHHGVVIRRRALAWYIGMRL